MTNEHPKRETMSIEEPTISKCGRLPRLRGAGTGRGTSTVRGTLHMEDNYLADLNKLLREDPRIMAGMVC